VVFYIPGYTASKEAGLSLAYRLARRGLACVSFDPLYHGERYDPCLEQAADPGLGGVYPPETGLDTGMAFFHVIRQCALDVHTLLARLASDARLDVQRAGVTGMSMGAYASFLAFADIPALCAAVPMMGLPIFLHRWQDLLAESAWSNPAWAAALEQVASHTQRHSEFIQRIDPAERLLEAAPRALLIMNGDFDHDQPKQYVLNWLWAAKAAYAVCPEQLQWRVYPVGHTVTPQMEEDAAEWLARHLARTEESHADPAS
jgi:pimeloyl-ACP methyl ester carboxylesterase